MRSTSSAQRNEPPQGSWVSWLVAQRVDWIVLNKKENADLVAEVRADPRWRDAGWPGSVAAYRAVELRRV